MYYLSVAMPRETKTSLFTSHVTQGLFTIVCLVGFALVILIFLQNYGDWKKRRKKVYENELEQNEAEKAANRDFFACACVCLVLAILFIVFAVVMGMKLFA